MLEILDLSAGERGLGQLRHVNCGVSGGQSVGLIGRSGSGKTALLEAIAGTIPVTEGHVRLHGLDITRLSAAARFWKGVIFVPKAGASLFGDLTVQEHMRLVCRRIRPEEREQAIQRALASFPLIEKRTDARAQSLSGGERQSLALAMVVACDASVVLIDEPSHGLSPSMRTAMVALLARMKSKRRMIVITEQFPQLLEEICDRMIAMENGRIFSS